MLAHDVNEDEGSLDVVLVVLPGLGDALPHGLQAGEVDDRRNVFLFEDVPHGVAVEHVDLIETRARTGDLLDTVERFLFGIGKIVEYDHIVPSIDELDAGMASDEPRTAGNENGFHGDLLLHDDASAYRSRLK